MFLKRSLFLVLLLLSAVVDVVGEEWRQWTDFQGRSIRARAVKVDGENVVFMLETGQRVLYPIEKLSADDQGYLKKLGEAQEAEDRPEALKEWPEIVAVPVSMGIETVAEDQSAKTFVYRSEHFEFRGRAKLAQSITREFSRLFEVTYQVVATLPLDLRPQSEQTHYIIELYNDKLDYAKAGGIAGSAGVYVPATRKIMVPLDSLGVKPRGSGFALEERKDNETLIHEVTHQLMHDWLGRIPIWMAEGAAEFVASGEYYPGKLSYRGHAGKLEDYVVKRKGVRDARNILILPLHTMERFRMMRGLPGPNGSILDYVSATMLFYYFARCDELNGVSPLIPYFREVGEGTPHQTALEKYLIRGRSEEQLNEDIRKGLRQATLRVEYTQVSDEAIGPYEGRR